VLVRPEPQPETTLIPAEPLTASLPVAWVESAPDQWPLGVRFGTFLAISVTPRRQGALHQ